MGVNLTTISSNASDADIHTIHLLQVARYYTVATVAIGAWDCIVCWPKEYTRIWKSPHSLLKYLYLTCRYGGLLALSFIVTAFTSDWTFTTCSRLAPLLPGLGVISTLSSNALLSLRTIALWEKNRGVTVGLIALLFADAGCLIAASVKFEAFVLPPGATGCYAIGAAGGRSLAILYWTVPCAVSALVFCLTMHRALLYWRSGESGLSPLLRIIVRDQTMYFGVIFAFNLLNVVFYTQNDVGLQPLNSPFAVMITSILSSRLVLNLKDESLMKSVIRTPHVRPLQTYHHFDGLDQQDFNPSDDTDSPDKSKPKAPIRVRFHEAIKKAALHVAIPENVYGKSEKVLGNFV